MIDRCTYAHCLDNAEFDCQICSSAFCGEHIVKYTATVSFTKKTITQGIEDPNPNPAIVETQMKNVEFLVCKEHDEPQSIATLIVKESESNE